MSRPTTDAPTFDEQMAAPHFEVPDHHDLFTPPEPMTDEAWVKVEAALRHARIQAGHCPACGDDADPVLACGCTTWVHQMDSAHVHCIRHGDVTLMCADGGCGEPRMPA